MGQKVPKAASANTPGSLNLLCLSNELTAYMSSAVKSNPKRSLLAASLSGFDDFGTTAVPLWTAHLKTI